MSDPIAIAPIAKPLTITQAADVLQVSPRIVNRMISAGELRAVRVGSRFRISSDDLQLVGRDRVA